MKPEAPSGKNPSRDISDNVTLWPRREGGAEKKIHVVFELAFKSKDESSFRVLHQSESGSVITL